MSAGSAGGGSSQNDLGNAKIDLKTFVGVSLLGQDEDAPHRWCENFTAWVETSGISSQNALRVLRAQIIPQRVFVLNRIAAEYTAACKTVPTSASATTEHDAYLEHVMSVLPDYFLMSNDYKLPELNQRWNGFQQDGEPVQAMADRLAGLVDEFNKLSPPVTKTTKDQADCFFAGLDPKVRSSLIPFHASPVSRILESDTESTKVKKFAALISAAAAIERDLRVHDAAYNDQLRAGGARGRVGGAHAPPPSSTGSRGLVGGAHTPPPSSAGALPYEQTLCRIYASGHHCRFGARCKRCHMTAAEFKQHPLDQLQGDAEKRLIDKIVRSRAAPGHPATTGSIPQTPSSTSDSSGRNVADLAAQVARLTAIVSSMQSSASTPTATLDLSSTQSPASAPITTLDLDRP